MRKYFIFTCLAVVIFFSFGDIIYGQEEGAAEGEVEAQESPQLDAQLEINRKSLLSPATDAKIREDVAVVLLLSSDPEARAILMEALGQGGISESRRSVCRALVKSLTWEKSVASKDEFLEPLFVLLKSGSSEDAVAAGDALVIFPYNKVGNKLKEAVSDPNAEEAERLNAVYALRVRSEKAAILDLIGLLDVENKKIKASIEDALQRRLGIPVGTSQKEWKRIANDLRRQDPEEFTRARLALQEKRVHDLQEQVEKWRVLYLKSLDKIYQRIDDEVRQNFLAEQLNSDSSSVQLWALKRISEWKEGGKILADSLGQKIVDMISNEDVAVRLQAAKLLAGLSRLNPSAKILKQLEAEADEQVKIELLRALGEAVYFALVPSSPVKLDESVRMEALNWAAQYLGSEDEAKVKAGAQVIRKLLETNGLDNALVEGYFSKLADRYNALNADSGQLRGELVGVMSQLCSSNSFYRVVAVKQFRDIFRNGLNDETNFVREAAVAGLANTGESEALDIFKENVLQDDKSPAVRRSVMDLARRVGGVSDLDWLFKKLGKNGDGESAWASFYAILDRADAADVVFWVKKLDSAGIERGYIDSLLALAEKKVQQEDREDALAGVYELMAEMYAGMEDYDKAAGYYNKVLENGDESSRDRALAGLTGVYLDSGKIGAVESVLRKRLDEKDIAAGDLIIERISAYLSDDSVEEKNKTALLALLGVIENGEPRPLWEKQLQSWRERMGFKQGSS